MSPGFILKTGYKFVFDRPGGGEDADDEGNGEFGRLIESLFVAMGKLLYKREQYQDPYILVEGACLKHIPAIIGDLIQVYPPARLSERLVALVHQIPTGKLTKQKLQFITDIVHSELFLDAECRTMLISIVTDNIKNHLPGHQEVRNLQFTAFSFQICLIL